jgi:hypothetical protein
MIESSPKGYDAIEAGIWRGIGYSQRAVYPKVTGEVDSPSGLQLFRERDIVEKRFCIVWYLLALGETNKK